MMKESFIHFKPIVLLCFLVRILAEIDRVSKFPQVQPVVHENSIICDKTMTHMPQTASMTFGLTLASVNEIIAFDW